MFTHNLVTPPLIKQADIDGVRRYVTPEGNSYESVTTYLSRVFDKPHLHAWKKRVGAKKAASISTAASKRGTSLHTVVNQYIENRLDEANSFSNDPLTKDLFVKIKPLLNRLNNINLTEKPLYSSVLGLAGTPDIIAEYRGDLSVVDLKTSTRVKKKTDIVDYFLQCACYAIMFNEHFNRMPKKAVIIMAIPTLSYGMTYIHPMEECISMLENLMRDPIAFNKKVAASTP